MNILSRIFCRIYQFALWSVFPLLPYREPLLIDNGVDGIPNTLLNEGKRRPLVITDEGIVKLGLCSILEASLKNAGFEYSIYSNVVANPTTVNVADAIDIYKNDHCDCLIGFGGGSSIDTAKAVGACIANPRKSLSQMKGILKVLHKIPLLIAIPTTAGTGSETTLASVIVDAETRHKYAISDFPLIPKYAVLDPDMTRSLPRSLTATTGMDALTHAIESYIGKSNHKMTKIEAKIAVRLIFANLRTAFENGDDMKARSNLLRASYLAGCSFTRSYVGYVHAIAHSLGGQYNIAHGYANAVILPIVLDSYGDKINKKLKKLAIAANVADELTPEDVAAKAFIDEIRNMNKYFGIGTSIPEIQVDDIALLSRNAAKEANPLYPVPVLLSAKELEKQYYMIKG